MADQPRLSGPSPPHLGHPETGPREPPASVIRFIRGLEAAQRSGTVEHVRRLCAESGPFLESLDAAARAAAEQSVEQAKTWLTGHEDYQQRGFADLSQAVTEKRTFDVRSQLQLAAALTRRGASAWEQRVLATARAFLREQNHLPAAGSSRTLPTASPPRPQRKRSQRKEAPSPQKAPEPAKEPHSARRERRAQRAAVRRARQILQQLDQKLHLSADEQRKLTDELATVVKAADDWLSDASGTRPGSGAGRCPGPGGEFVNARRDASSRRASWSPPPLPFAGR